MKTKLCQQLHIVIGITKWRLDISCMLISSTAAMDTDKTSASEVPHPQVFDLDFSQHGSVSRQGALSSHFVLRPDVPRQLFFLY